jgi:hypothetical protein
VWLCGDCVDASGDAWPSPHGLAMENGPQNLGWSPANISCGYLSPLRHSRRFLAGIHLDIGCHNSKFLAGLPSTPSFLRAVGRNLLYLDLFRRLTKNWPGGFISANVGRRREEANHPYSLCS